MKKLALYYHTLKQLKFKQLFFRAWYRFYHPKISLSVDDIKVRSIEKQIDSGFLNKNNIYFTGSIAIFLNHRVNIESKQIWNDKMQEKLWLYNLHYFDALNASDIKQREMSYSLLQRWIQENPFVEKGNAWEAYPISLRIVNIVKYALSGSELDQEVLYSLYLQTRYLNKMCEYHLLGNHLLENFKALCFVGLFFQGSEANRWFAKGFNGLKKEIQEQVLEDGGHFELSPMYHCIVLEGMLDLKNIFTIYDKANLFCWDSEIEKMLNWLQLMMRNPNSISYFNDAADGIASPPSQILTYAESLDYQLALSNHHLHYLYHSGYIVYKVDRVKAILDIAKIGPDYLPGHGHADTLSFELMIDEQPVLVNLGTSCYGLSQRRLFERSTQAHNTVYVPDYDSSQVWAGFRVAKRAIPRLIALREGEQTVCVRASHNGYQRLNPRLTHTRQLQLNSESLSIIDELSTSYPAVGYLHLHPDCQIINQHDKCIVISLPNGETMEVGLQRDYEIKDSQYANSFGCLSQTKSIFYFLEPATNSTAVSIKWS